MASNRGGDASPAFVLYPTKLVEGMKERALQTPLVTGELGEGVPFSGVGFNRPSKENLVAILLVCSALKRLARLRMRGLVRNSRERI